MIKKCYNKNMIKRRCKITFIRHGATIYTEADRLSDKDNYPPINEAGKEEMEAVSQWIKKRGLMVDKIFCSPETRATQSARVLSKICKQDFEVIPDLTAKKSGTWSGLSFEQIEEKYPKELEAYHNDRANFVMPNGESISEFNERTNKVIERIVKENNSSRIIIVTHGDVIQSAIAKILHIPADYQTRIMIPTGSATQISYFKDWSVLVYSGIIEY